MNSLSDNMMKKLLTILTTCMLGACSVTDYRVKTESHSQFSADGKQVKVEQLLKTSQSWDGTDLPAYPYAEPEITMLKVTIPVGVTLDMHKHLVINAAYMLRGHLKVISATGDELELKAGDTIAEMVNSWHQGMNIGAEPVEIVVFYAGAKGTALTVKQQ